MECVAQTRELADRIAAKDYDTALTMRGDSYTEMVARLPLASRTPLPERPSHEDRAEPDRACSTSAAWPPG